MVRFRSLRVLFLVALVTVGALAIPAGQASAGPGALKILIVYADSSAPATLQSQLQAQPGVASVDLFDGGSSTPTDAQLDAYDEVVVSNLSPWDDATAMGNNLADFQDQGGVVVGTGFTWQGVTTALQGRWITDGYSPYQTGGTSDFSEATLGADDASNPLMAGVDNLEAHYRDTLSLTTGASQIAGWSDGASAVAVKGNALGINAYLGDGEGLGQWSGDFPRLIVNAGNVLGPHTLSVSKSGTGSGTVGSSPAGINCGPTCSAMFTNGSTVTLTASASPGSAFTGWSGACSGGSHSCTVTMSAARSVTATFSPATFVSPPHNTKITGVKINRKKHTARFKFTASGTVGGWQCALVKPKANGKLPKHPKLKWRSCTSPKLYKHLNRHGHYKFEVRATNSTGHDPKPAVRKFKL